MVVQPSGADPVKQGTMSAEPRKCELLLFTWLLPAGERVLRQRRGVSNRLQYGEERFFGAVIIAR
jgi:hypothetical protein